MRNHLPGRTELLLFAAIAFLAATIVVLMKEHDTGLSLVSMPVFLTGAMLGLWRSGRLRPLDE